LITNVPSFAIGLDAPRPERDQERDGSAGEEDRDVVGDEAAVEPCGNCDDDRDHCDRAERPTTAREEGEHDREDEHDVQPQRAFRPVFVAAVDHDCRDPHADARRDEGVEPVARGEALGGSHHLNVLRKQPARLVHADETVSSAGMTSPARCCG
jgi:hypothetical protein